MLHMLQNLSRLWLLSNFNIIVFSNDLFPILQSAYQPNHSTETTLLKVPNDILLNMNDQRVTLLLLVDLSAAFDTVDHDTLLHQLQFTFGVNGKVLSWFWKVSANSH